MKSLMLNTIYSFLNVISTKTDLLMLVKSTIVSSTKKTTTEFNSVVKMLSSTVHVTSLGKTQPSLVMPPGNVVISCTLLEKLLIMPILTEMVLSMLWMMLTQNT